MASAPPNPYHGLEEDRIDRWFNRKLAWPIAAACVRLGVHPNLVSVAGLALGLTAGWFFQFPDFAGVWPGALLLLFATVLDNADGMVARKTGKSSQLGYVLDGICDNLVFMGIYAWAIGGLWERPALWEVPWGFWGLALGLLAGVSHSFQSAMLDFYKIEWRYWALRDDRSRFVGPAGVRERLRRARGVESFFLRLRALHAIQQVCLSRARHAVWPVLESKRAEACFPEAYVRRNLLPLKGWFLLGPNWHVITIIGFGLAGRMDLYFVSQITLFNVILLGTMVVQASRDEDLARMVTPRGVPS
jgi:hypothetical protein